MNGICGGFIDISSWYRRTNCFVMFFRWTALVFSAYDMVGPVRQCQSGGLGQHHISAGRRRLVAIGCPWGASTIRFLYQSVMKSFYFFERFHMMKRILPAFDKRDCFLTVPLMCFSVTTPAIEKNYPCSPLACLSISSMTISWISPNEAQYSKTIQGSLVWKWILISSSSPTCLLYTSDAADE